MAQACLHMMYTDFVKRSQLQNRITFDPLTSDAALRQSPASVERTLVISAQSGSHAAFNALVQKYRQRVFKLSLRYMRNHADAEDVVQETFVKAYGALKLFRGDCAFYSWLHRIAINAAKTAVQNRSREAHILSTETLTADAGADGKIRVLDLDTPEDIALTHEICSAVNDAIEALSDEQRVAIVLREFNGHSYRAVAHAMDCPVGTVRSRVFRAREAIDQRVRKVFEEGLGRRRALRMPDLAANEQGSVPA